MFVQEHVDFVGAVEMFAAKAAASATAAAGA